MPEEEKVYCSMYSRNAELYHHGIKGQKWGVRNGPPYPLGSDVSTGSRLKKNSEEIIGSKNPSEMESKKIHSYFKKEVRKKRKDKFGAANQWMTVTPIGPKSEKLINEYEKNYRNYINSEEYQTWVKELNRVDRKAYRDMENEKISWEEYEAIFEEAVSKQPPKDFLDLSFKKVYDYKPGRLNLTKFSHWTYPDDYLKKGGMALTIAYLEDLGYSNKEAKMYAKEMAKQGYTLGDI